MQAIPARRKMLARSAMTLATGTALAALGPGTSALAQPSLDFAQKPPGSMIPYVAPNVLITFDDSGSMNYWFDNMNAPEREDTGIARDRPVDKTWPDDTKRISVLKYSVLQAFSDPSFIKNEKIRLGWQAMHNQGRNRTNFPNANDINNPGPHSMRTLNDAHRMQFLKYVSDIEPISGNDTAIHKMAHQAHKYMSAAGQDINSPWAFKPGEQAEPFLGCRRSYHILISDGDWRAAPINSQDPGNADGSAMTLPDGTRYNAIYPYADSHANTIADWAFKSWSTRLRDDLEGKLAPIMDCQNDPKYFGNDTKGESAWLSCYWDPRNNPATWPHMVTHTIGISRSATRWPGELDIYPPDEIVPFGYEPGKSGSLPDLITGNIKWPKFTTSTEDTKNSLDLWHSAINSRGRYYVVENDEDLIKIFEAIIGKTNQKNEFKITSFAASGSNSTRNEVGLFSASYDPGNHWSGTIVAQSLDKHGNPESAWGEGQSTAVNLDALNLNERVILSWNDGTDDARPAGGIPFDWGSYSKRQRVWLGAGDGRKTGTNDPTGADAVGENRLEYVRGDRSREGVAATDGASADYDDDHPFRERGSRQGDIVNSEIWYVAGPVSGYSLGGYGEFVNQYKDRPAMLYVGGNDGMLHGFAAENGSEKIAYVPQGVVPDLHELTDPDYEHRYYVDGSPYTGDLKIDADNSASSWRTYLVGTLGAGGKGYFVLNVTDPGDFSTQNAGNLIILDQTWSTRDRFADDCANRGSLDFPANSDTCENAKDIGHIFATPVRDARNNARSGQVAQLNNGRWAAIMGNGYNSQNGRPVLLVQYLDGQLELKRVPVEDGDRAGGNGLSAPRPVDIDGDGRMDVVYAGDLQGNLWKFDLTSSSDSNWKVAFEEAPLYSINRPDLEGETGDHAFIPTISGAPITRANDRGAIGLMVAFGSGRNVTVDDWNNKSTQTLYAVLDNTQYELVSGNGTEHIRICDPASGCNPKPVPSGVGSHMFKLTLGEPQAGTNASADHIFWALSDPTDDPNAAPEDIVAATIDWEKHRGWYLDLPEKGERLLKNLGFYAGSNVLAAYTQVPASQIGDVATESCEALPPADELQYLTLINIMDGRRPGIPILDMNGDGLYTADDNNVSRVNVSAGSLTEVDIIGKRAKGVKRIDDLEVRLPPRQALRPNWRQLQ